MPAHNVRTDLNLSEPSYVSSTDGETIFDQEVWGMEIQLETGGAETRTLLNPERPGLELALTMTVDGGNCVVSVPSGTVDGTNDTMTFADVGDLLLLKSFTVAPDTVNWRIVLNVGSVALS